MFSAKQRWRLVWIMEIEILHFKNDTAALTFYIISNSICSIDVDISLG